MKRLWLFSSCVLLLLLLVGCGPSPDYSGKVETGRVTNHRPATAPAATSAAAPQGTQEAQDVVYMTRTGKRHHRQSCPYAQARRAGACLLPRAFQGNEYR